MYNNRGSVNRIYPNFKPWAEFLFQLTISLKSKNAFVKCLMNGELSSGRKAPACGSHFASRFIGHQTEISYLLFMSYDVETEVFFMNTTKSKNTGLGSIRLFGNVRVMIISGLFIAMSIILGKFAHIAIGDSIRISFENLPVIMAGIFFGPFVGGAVGIGADLIGCILKGYAINPIITVGCASIGIISGFMAVLTAKLPLMFKVPVSVLTAHIIGSMIIKSIGLYIYYHTPHEVLMMRIPLYLATTALESLIIYLLLKNKSFSKQLNKITGK